MMWSADCGIIPIVDDGKLCGVITDRDICIALGTRNQRASEVCVSDVATQPVEACEADSDVHAVMSKMRKARIRRIPVVNSEGGLQGMLTLNDLILAAERKHGALDYEEVMNTLKAVSDHLSHERQQAQSAVAAGRQGMAVA
jgi:signal-transduction protein with cAMP-binding, CBS, and nucleotidyltransferase domain